MKTRTSLSIALFTLACGADAAKAAEIAQVPQNLAAKAAADVIVRVERAIIGYVSACASDDPRSLDSVLTEDARVEFALDEPGTYFSVDASSSAAECVAGIHASASPSIANLWIFPTRDADAVFVQYDVPASTGTLRAQRLVLVEMRGDRIARMLNFASPSSHAMSYGGRVTKQSR